MVTDELDIRIECVTAAMLDSHSLVSISMDDTIVLNGEGAKEESQARCEQIRPIIADPITSDFDRCQLQDHLEKFCEVSMLWRLEPGACKLVYIIHDRFKALGTVLSCI